MAQPARILVIDEKASADRAQIWGELDRFGFATRACAPIDVSRALRSAEPPDVVVVDGRSGISEHLLAAELETARNRGNGIPPAVLFLARDGDPNSGRLVGAGRVLFPPIDPGRLALNLSGLLRQAAIEQEIARRMVAAERSGAARPMPPKAPAQSEEAAVLVVGVGRTFLKIESALACFADVVGAPTVGIAEDYLARFNFDALVIEQTIDFDAALAFVSQLRRNPRLATLPVILLLDPSFMMGVREAYAAGVTEIMPASFKMEDFAIHMAIHAGEIRAQRQLYSAVREIQKTETPGLKDRDFLTEYLEVALDHGRITGMPVHLAALRVSDLAEIREACGAAAGDKALGHVTDTLQRLVRAEHLIARVNDDTLAAVFVGADAETVDAAIARVAAVVRLTTLSLDNGEPLTVDVESKLARAGDGDNAETLIERAVTQV